MFCFPLQSRSCLPFIAAFRLLTHSLCSFYLFSLSGSGELLGWDRLLPFCTSYSETVDGLVAVAQLWQCTVSFAEVAEGRRRSELRSTVGWSIRHRVKCSPRETGRGRGAQAGRRWRRQRGRGGCEGGGEQLFPVTLGYICNWLFLMHT